MSNKTLYNTQMMGVTSSLDSNPLDMLKHLSASWQNLL